MILKLDLNNIYNMLDSSNDIITQSKGVELAINTGYISEFILPMLPLYNKNIWENCAKIIASKSDSELEPYIIQIFEWLQDLTWPGTFLVIERLKKYDGQILKNPYSNTIKEILNIDQYSEWINNLSKLIENKELAEGLDKDLYNIVYEKYMNFWMN